MSCKNDLKFPILIIIFLTRSAHHTKTIFWRLRVLYYKHQYNDLSPISDHLRKRQLNAGGALLSRIEKKVWLQLAEGLCGIGLQNLT